MHFIIKDKSLKKIKDKLFIFNENSISFKKIENLNIVCTKNFLDFYINNSFLNFKLSIKNQEDLEIIKEGNVSINLKTFYLYLENLKDNNILEVFNIEENLLQIHSKNFTCNLIIFNFENEFKDLFNTDKYLKIIFSYQFLKTIYFRFKDFCKLLNGNFKNKTILSTINLKKEKNSSIIEVLSSNSYKAIFGSFSFKDLNSSFNINIFPQIINIIILLFSENKEIEIFIYEEEFLIKNDEIFIKSKLFKGNYPYLNKWFNMEINTEFLINKNEILKAIDRSLLLSSKNLTTTFYKLENDKLWIEYKNSQKGFSKEYIEIKNLKKNNIDFSLDNNLLKLLIKNIDSEEIFFNISESLKPIIIFGNENFGNFKQFILPIKNH